MLHQIYVAEVSVLDGFEAESRVFSFNGLEVSPAQAPEDDGIVTGQVLQEPLASLENFIGKVLVVLIGIVFGPSPEVEDIPEHVNSHLTQSQFY